MSGHYYEYKGQTNKLHDLALFVRSTLNWMINGFLNENGITQYWGDAVVNNVVLKACDLTYDLRALDNTIEYTYEKVAIAYSAVDNTSYSRKIYDLDTRARFTYYRIWNKPNKIRVVTESAEMIAQNLKSHCNDILTYCYRISTTGISSEILRSSSFLYDYGMIRGMAKDIVNKGHAISSAIIQCMNIYKGAEGSYKSEDASTKYINSLGIYSMFLKSGIVPDINEVYKAVEGDISYSSITGEIKNGGKELNKWLAAIAECYDKAKNLKNVKSGITGVTANVDSLAKLVDGKDFSLSDLMSLVKSDASWLSSILKSKSGDLLHTYADMDKRTKDAKLTFLKSEKYADFSKSVSVIGDGADLFGNIYDFATNKDGTDLNDVVGSGIDFSNSSIGFGVQIFKGTEAAKAFSKKAGGWFTLGKVVFDTGNQISDSFNKYNSDGKLTSVEKGKIGLESSLSGLNTLVSSVTFGLVEFDVDSTSNALYDWSEDVSYQTADKLAEKNNSPLDKAGIAIESKWKNRNTRFNDSLMDLVASNNSAYTAYKAARMSQVDIKNYNVFNFESRQALNNDLAALNSSISDDENLSIEEKIQKYQNLIHCD